MSSTDATSVGQLIAGSFERYAVSRAVLTEDGWLNFNELEAFTAVGIEKLREMGTRPGDRVILSLPNCSEFRVLEYAVLCGGLVRVAVSPRLHPREIAGIAHDSAATLVICEPSSTDEYLMALREVGSAARVVTYRELVDLSVSIDHRHSRENAPEVAAVDGVTFAMIMYSSGTTGAPKGAVVTHAAWLAQTRRSLGELPAIGAQDVVLAVAPMAHFGGSIALNCATAGAATVFLDRFDSPQVIEAIDAYGVTVLPLVPVLLERLVDAAEATGRSFPTLRAVPYGGSPIAGSLLRRAVKVFPGVLFQFYGLAEALAPLACLSPGDHDAGAVRARSDVMVGETSDRMRSAGQWLPGVEHRLDDSGELFVRGEVVMPGYWGRGLPEDSGIDSQGWFETRDLASFNKGYVYLLGRADDVIITGGFKVNPGEIERVILTVPGIKYCAVFGLPNEVWGQSVNVAIVLTETGTHLYAGPTGSEKLSAAVIEACRHNLASYKKPLTIQVVSDLPRTAVGKLNRRALAHISPTRSTPTHTTETTTTGVTHAGT